MYKQKRFQISFLIISILILPFFSKNPKVIVILSLVLFVLLIVFLEHNKNNKNKLDENYDNDIYFKIWYRYLCKKRW